MAALEALGSRLGGLTSEEAAARLAAYGPNALRAHGASSWEVLARQFRSYLVLLLLAAAVVAGVVGDRVEAGIILAIVGLSAALGFVNEFRSERAVEALHAQIRHTSRVVRDGVERDVDVTELVPGDVVRLRVGNVVPADLRLLETAGLECDESVLTGESAAAVKLEAAAVPDGSPLALASVAFMGTVVRTGGALGVVVRTGGHTAFGAIALRLGERQQATSFQRGLQEFSRMLVVVTGILAGSIFVLDIVVGRSVLQSALFALAIAVGLTPQLLPAIVTVSLATGARRLARGNVIVKRLVSIEDIGNVEVLFTDKTGTLTEGRITFTRSLGVGGEDDPTVAALGLLAADPDANELDRALAAAAGEGGVAAGYTRITTVPFDHERQLGSALVDCANGRRIVVKGAPEAVLARSAAVPPGAPMVLEELFGTGSRVVAVAERQAPGLETLTPADERDLELRGFLCFADVPKLDAAASLRRLAALGVDVKIVTGDNGLVAEHVCEQIGMDVVGTLTGADLAGLSDAELQAALPHTTIFARVTPEQKSRVITAQRALGTDVGFLGDGVNDALALHDADVGISVDTGAEVAKDAADVVLLTKDLGILADGVVEGRRIFANTIKYVLMGTSSNFGNMFSAAGASLFLSFLPMLPSQILLNNLLYDISELTIPTDEVDAELLARPSQWDIGLIRRFMASFGPISSLYDFLTFAVMLRVFDAGPDLFRSGWFVESLASQTLVIFVIRTRRLPFVRSRPSTPLAVTTALCALVGVAIPYSPLAGTMGFTGPPLGFLVVLVLMVGTYLALVEAGKAVFFRRLAPKGPALAPRLPPTEHRIHRRAARWSVRALAGAAADHVPRSPRGRPHSPPF